MSETWKRWEGYVVNGEFPLQSYLGGGDRSAVFLTQCEAAGVQRAAIKLVLADPDQSEGQLFRWRLAAKLPDPRLIRILAMGRSRLDETDLLYLVMEHADEDLSQILPQRPLTPDEAREMLGPVLEALKYVHSKGFVHGSIQPSNVMAVADRVKLSSDSLHTLQEATKRERGASRYAPPEASGGPISSAADVWSLGMTIVETLTQRLPVLDPARPGAVLLPEGIPEPFLTIARHSLQPDPQQRCTIAEIAARLNPAPAAAQVTKSPTPATTGGRKSSAKWLYLTAVAAGLVTLVWISGSRTKTSRAPDQLAQTEPQKAQPIDSEPSPAKPSPALSAKMPSVQQADQPATSSAAAPTVAPGPANAAPKPDLEPGAAVPGVVHTVMPLVSQGARNTIQGKIKVRVRVQVDTSGNVASAVLDSPGPSKYFARLALEAAQGWKFAPAQAQGQAVVSQWILRFTFRRTDTEVVPRQTNP